MLTLADGRVLTGRQALDAKLIDAIGGEAEAKAWLESDKKIAADLPVITQFPLEGGWPGIGKFFGSQVRTALGLDANAPIVLDGLMSLWQVGPS
jgi:protease-4